MEKNRYKNIEYLLEKSKRKKTISLYIERDGNLKLIAPVDITVEEIERVIHEKARWIISNQLDWQEMNKNKKERQIVDGEGFFYLGKSYKLKLADDLEVDMKLYRGRLYLNAKKIKKSGEIFKNFYREKAKLKFTERVDYYKKMMGVEPQEIKIINLQSRWGSCTEDAKLIFNWKIIMAPLDIIDYVVVHELAHIKFKNHSSEFWNLVDKVLPDFQKKKDWLKENGVKLDI
ncbi:MAG: M48 family metallopeptidase [Paraclostridium sp.]